MNDTDLMRDIEADERLRDAAPKMLEVLRCVAEYFRDTNAPLGDSVRRVIAEAEGKS